VLAAFPASPTSPVPRSGDPPFPAGRIPTSRQIGSPGPGGLVAASKFDVEKLVRIADIYHEDFSFDHCKTIKDQLRTFIIHVRRVEEFNACYDLASLSKTMVQLKRHIVFPLVYRLIELALLLSVATAMVERAFSAIKIIKTEFRNKMTDG
jgi:hypothetical protein